MRRAHPLTRFRHRLVGQPDHGERRQTRGDLHLSLDIDHVDALECNRIANRDHSVPTPFNLGFETPRAPRPTQTRITHRLQPI
jgi:hypothetical protein